MLDGRQLRPDAAGIGNDQRGELPLQALMDHIGHQVGADPAIAEPVIRDHSADDRRPIRDRRQFSRILDVGFEANPEIVAARDIADGGRPALRHQHHIFRLHERPEALDIEVGRIAYRFGLEEHQRIEPRPLERSLDLLALDPMQLRAGVEFGVALLEERLAVVMGVHRTHAAMIARNIGHGALAPACHKAISS